MIMEWHQTMAAGKIKAYFGADGFETTGTALGGILETVTADIVQANK